MLRRILALTFPSSLMRVEATLCTISNHAASGNNAVTSDRQMVEDLTEDIRSAIHIYEVSNNLPVQSPTTQF